MRSQTPATARFHDTTSGDNTSGDSPTYFRPPGFDLQWLWYVERQALTFASARITFCLQLVLQPMVRRTIFQHLKSCS
jgi:hypothetical protein